MRIKGEKRSKKMVSVIKKNIKKGVRLLRKKGKKQRDGQKR